MARPTHTRHCVLILDDDLTQEPSLIVLVHGGRAGWAGGQGPQPRVACRWAEARDSPGFWDTTTWKGFFVNLLLF